MFIPESHRYPSPEEVEPGSIVKILNRHGGFDNDVLGHEFKVISSTGNSITLELYNGYHYNWICTENKEEHYFELISCNITTDIILNQLDNLSEKIKEGKLPSIIK